MPRLVLTPQAISVCADCPRAGASLRSGSLLAPRPARPLQDQSGGEMPEFRQAPIVHRWVLASSERHQHPSDFQPRPSTPPLNVCRCCFGHTAMTSGELLAYCTRQTKPNAPGWMVRVAPNQYPHLRNAAAAGRTFVDPHSQSIVLPRVPTCLLSGRSLRGVRRTRRRRRALGRASDVRPD
jgi:galactose-1-phosphate uridylyltransferase